MIIQSVFSNAEKHVEELLNGCKELKTHNLLTMP